MTPITQTTLEALCPRNPSCDEEREWYDTHAPCLANWLDQDFPEDGEDYLLARYACSSLLGAPGMRAYGPSEWGRSREPYCWDEIDAFELIHENLDHGFMYGWDYAQLLGYLRRAVMALIEDELIPEPHASALVASLEVGIPRAIGARRTGWISPPQAHAVPPAPRH